MTAMLSVSLLGLAACGPSAVATDEAGRSTADSTSTSTAAPTPALIGRWMQVHTCDQLVAALRDAGLGAVVPGAIGDFFPTATFEELAAKSDPCSGARPQRHDHFFDAAGAFGSIDQLDQQVDDGAWTLEHGVLRIGEGAWRVSIDGGKLSLEPIVSKQQIRWALAHPKRWSPASWIIAVSYPGSTWQRVPCDGWC